MRSTRRFTAFWASLTVVTVSLSCTEGPTAGELEMVFDTPRNDIVALQFAIAATDPATIDTVTAACAGCTLYMSRVSTSEVRGVLTGTGLQGLVLRVLAADLARAPAGGFCADGSGNRCYRGTVLDAATADYNTVSVSGFRLRVAGLTQ